MANFANRSDAISVLRADYAAVMTAYRQLATDISNARDFDYFDAGVAAGTAPLVTADFQTPTGNANADIATAAAFYADVAVMDQIISLFTATRRKAGSRLSPR